MHRCRDKVGATGANESEIFGERGVEGDMGELTMCVDFAALLSFYTFVIKRMGCCVGERW